jgi:hypothetical protein
MQIVIYFFVAAPSALENSFQLAAEVEPAVIKELSSWATLFLLDMAFICVLI